MNRSIRSLCALALFLPALAFANCGNDKPVGTGCTTNPPAVTSPASPSATAHATGGNAQSGATALNLTSVTTSVNAALNSNASAGLNATVNANAGSAQQSQTLTGSTSSSTGNAVSVSSYSVDNSRNPVSTAYSPALQSTVNCAIAVTGGISLAGFSGSAGTAYRDENCVVLEQVKTVATLGDIETATEMLCTQPLYHAARARMGKPCRYVLPVKAEPVLTSHRDY